MISPFSAIISYSGNDLIKYLKERELYEIFIPLMDEYGSSLFPAAVKFVLYSYSIESEVLHSTGVTWATMSEVIYKKAGLPANEEMFDRIGNLKDSTIQEVINNWLDFQDNEFFTDYIHARDLRKKCLQLSKGDGKLKEQLEAIKTAKECLQMMEDAKSKFISNYDLMRPAVTALKKERKTLGPQDFAK